MKIILALQIASLLLLSTTSMAATVKYQDTNLTIVTREEQLDSVLKALGKEMRIYVTIPTGLNPMVNCDIQQQPVKQAFKTLLGDMSYSLEWEEATGRLVGLTILAGSDTTAGSVVSDESTYTKSVEQSAPVSVTGREGRDAGLLAARSDAAMAANEAQREEGEARMVEKQEAQEEALKEDAVRHEAETVTYLNSVGLELSW